jgi:hypothetical protein
MNCARKTPDAKMKMVERMTRKTRFRYKSDRSNYNLNGTGKSKSFFRRSIGVRSRPLHPSVGVNERIKIVLSIKPMSITSSQNPTPQALKIRVRNYDLHQQFAEAPTAIFV